MRTMIVAALLAMAPSALAQTPQVIGEDAEACKEGASGPAFLVTVAGFKDRKGAARVEVYAARDDEFLVSSQKLIAAGKVFRRIDVSMSDSGAMDVCITVPAPGDYAIVALHDRDLNGKLSVFGDGVGVSRNPKLRLQKPKVATVQLSIGMEVKPVSITLNYLQGLAVGPVKR
jgi:uncharacterized protein (DUF2141 family)